jgi:hypothetical protein
MRKPSKELRDLYTTYLKKRLRPENALEFASGFILDLINAFGEKVEGNSVVAAGHTEFSPFNFLLQLNELLARYKQDPKSLDDVEKSILRDTHLMIGTLIRSALNPPTLPTESNHERYQLPAETASDLEWLVDNAS